jgi:hypothetical protein
VKLKSIAKLFSSAVLFFGKYFVIVIAIIGVLITLLLPAVQAARETAKCSQMYQQTRNNLGLPYTIIMTPIRHSP